MSLVTKKTLCCISLRFPAFAVDIEKELSESELRQFHIELKRLEGAVAEQLGTFASVIARSSQHNRALRMNMDKIMRYAEGKSLFTAKDIHFDLALSNGVVYDALTGLVAEKKLTKRRLSSGGFGYTLAKRNDVAPAIDVECEEARQLKGEIRRSDAATVQARIDSK